jgi:hypothetical protein
MRERLIVTGVLAVLCVAAGCRRPNPDYIPPDGGMSGVGGGSAGGSGGGGGAGGNRTDAGTDGTVKTCTTAADCTATAPCTAICQSNGTCGVNCPSCTDNDKDGYGSGSMCMGADCNDNDPTILDQQTCYTGPSGTATKGVCRAGTVFCTTNAQSSCTGQVTPGGEACNNQDDDCNGTVDDPTVLGKTTCGLGACAKTVDVCAAGGVLTACVPTTPAANTTDGCEAGDADCDGALDEDCLGSCVYVTSAGDDTTADGTLTMPFKTIAAAITAAAASKAAGTTKNVCIAAIPTCDSTSPQPFDSGDNAPLVMSNGVNVYGNYESTGGSRCALTTLSTTIRTGAAVAVQFPSTVVDPTILDGVNITRLSSGGAASATGILVDGAQQVLLSNIRIVDAPGAASTYGVDLAHGAQATITRSTIQAGGGTTEAIGIRSIGAKPTIRDNCSTFDATSGACTAACSATLGIRARAATPAAGTSAAILLDTSPGAIVDRNTICGAQAATGTGVHIIRDATGTAIRANTIVVTGATMEAHGVWMDACMSATPRIGGNVLIQADATAAAAVISAVGVAGDCHPVIDSNLKITGGADSTGTTTVGVSCGAATATGATTAVASRCTIIGNKLVQGAASAQAAKAIAIQCTGGACLRIAGNVVNAGAAGDAIGISLAGSTGLVERNDVTGGCGSGTSLGALADDAPARFENNILRGAACATGATTTKSSGIRVAVSSSANETELHSNTLDGGGTGTCTGAAATLGLHAANSNPAGGVRGVLRNNILHAGGCNTRYGLWEDDTGTSVRLLENNDFDPTSSGGLGAPTALYFFRAANPMNPVTSTTTGVRSNLSVDPMFTAFPTDLHLGAASMCVNKGTTEGAPTVDFDGTARDAQPDIGAFEKK